MEEKKVIFLTVLMLLLFSFVSADYISNYKVSDNVPLGLNVTITGVLTADDNQPADVLCSFYLLDENGVLVNRLDDQYTDSVGTFASRWVMSEPEFKRGETYTAKSVCGDATQDANFLIRQRENIAHTGALEFDYVTDPSNVETLIAWGIMGVIIIGCLFLIVWLPSKWSLLK